MKLKIEKELPLLVFAFGMVMLIIVATAMSGWSVLIATVALTFVAFFYMVAQLIAFFFDHRDGRMLGLASSIVIGMMFVIILQLL